MNKELDWISIGNLWMFGGLLATMKRAKEK